MGWFLSAEARGACWAWERAGMWRRHWEQWFDLAKRRPVV